MNPEKLGRIFTIFMITLVAYGSASALNFFIEPSFTIEIPNFLPFKEKINPIGNPAFNPIWLQEHQISNITSVNATPQNLTPQNSSGTNNTTR